MMMMIIIIITTTTIATTTTITTQKHSKVQFEIFLASSLRREPSPTRTLKWPGLNRVQITCNTSSAYHLKHVVLRTTWCDVTAQLLRLTEFKSRLFELYFIGRTINWWRKGGHLSTRRKPLTTSFRKCHILKPDDSSPKRDSSPHNSIGDRLGKQTCKPLHHASSPGLGLASSTYRTNNTNTARMNSPSDNSNPTPTQNQQPKISESPL